ncbi:Gfo/Idh/MocA family oxidoreductase [Microbaculum marinum]|uniref:Gfo/Idh/MocA family oxidoreductase n=1 Tax=Microbaculum marinum TaxID=1764581 RepID=A0AAW9RKE8_9HYPH
MQFHNNTPLRAAIVGMGKVGRIRAGVLAARRDVALVAAADVAPEAAAALPGLRFETDYRRIVDSSDVDVVFVSTTNRPAAEIVCAALEHGKHVFCEKPPGRSIGDVERIAAIEANRPDLKLQFGFNHRYHGAVMEAKKLVDSGTYGRILWARGIYGKSGGADFERIWRSDPEEAGGGILLDQGIHMLDLFCHFMGDFTDVQSFVETMHWNIPLEDNAFALLRTEDRRVAMLHSSATHWRHRFSLEIALNDGYVNLAGILSPSRTYGEETLTHCRKDLTIHSKDAAERQSNTMIFDKDESWTLETGAFLEAVATGGPVRSGTSADALRAMTLVSRIYEARR